MQDKEALEIYKEISKVNAKLTIDIATKLDKVADNLLEMNDKNILHQEQVMLILKQLSNKYFKFIMFLVIIISVIAIGEKAVDLFKALI